MSVPSPSRKGWVKSKKLHKIDHLSFSMMHHIIHLFLHINTTKKNNKYVVVVLSIRGYRFSSLVMVASKE